MAFLELIFELVFADLLRATGVLVRWCFVAMGQLAYGREVMSLRRYYKKMARDKDPSNIMSDGIIHFLLGAAIWFGIIFLLV